MPGAIRPPFRHGGGVSKRSPHDESHNGIFRCALRLNQRPRKTLGFCTPADKLEAGVATTR
jgi:IS30 family transposase